MIPKIVNKMVNQGHVSNSLSSQTPIATPINIEKATVKPMELASPRSFRAFFVSFFIGVSMGSKIPWKIV